MFHGQCSYTPEYSCESPLVTVCRGVTDSMDEGVRTVTIIVHFSKAFDLVPHDRLLTKIAATGR